MTLNIKNLDLSPIGFLLDPDPEGNHRYPGSQDVECGSQKFMKKMRQATLELNYKNNKNKNVYFRKCSVHF